LKLLKLEKKMRIFGKHGLRTLRRLSCGLALASATCLTLPSQSFGDSWGSSGGSWGGSSGGSWGGSHGSSGGNGLFGGRRPVRNLLGRIGDRFHGGTSGGSSGGLAMSSHGSMGYSYASSGGSSFGSIGSSYGSTGSSFGSSGISSGSVGYYGSVGAHQGTVISSAPMTYSSNGAQYAPVIYDSGYVSSTMTNGSDVFRPVPGINYEGGTGTPTPAGQRRGDSSAPTPPAGDDGSTSIIPLRATVLSLKVPVDAKVYINDHQTKTTGELRRYVSRNLDPGRDYYYHIKAVVERDGKEIVRNEVVALKAGDSELVEFDFAKSITSLALSVPENAKVTLCGKTTNASGSARHFSTTKLETGQTWKDYTVEVAVEKNGRLIRQQKTLELVGGETYKLKFEFDETGEMLAVR
jgi:uncharacterized protein (TIGR03000 family)